MVERWYRNGIIYSVDVCMFQDYNRDGTGDLPGLTSRLNYLSRLGIDIVWLNPLYPSPRRDGGYDVVDNYGVDPRFGTLGDFADLLHQADERGIRIMIALVLNHTSADHPWFRAACTDPDSPYRDWYVWSDTEPEDRWSGAVFPGAEVIRYGDEIGMGEDLALPERDAVRTPMQWTDTENARFSTAAPRDLAAPVIAEGPYGYQDVNVLAQRRAPDSLLRT